jgi:hypothetical protein
MEPDDIQGLICPCTALSPIFSLILESRWKSKDYCIVDLQLSIFGLFNKSCHNNFSTFSFL